LILLLDIEKTEKLLSPGFLEKVRKMWQQGRGKCG